MRGAPILRLALATILLILAGIPIWSLTRPVSVPVPVRKAPSAVDSREVVLRLTAVPPADSLAVFLLGEMIPAASDGTRTVRLPTDAADLVVRGTWPDSGTACAVRVIATQDSLDLLDATLWGNGQIEDVVTSPAP
jgi:hypothetical protein